MAHVRRRLQRPLGERRYRKLFVIAVEGTTTEQEYFCIFNARSTEIVVKCLDHKSKSAPSEVLKCMKGFLRQGSFRNTDEAWLVIDRDHWPESQLDMLYEWALQNGQYGVALSNPKFEYWLLLHFEDGDNIASPRECSDRLARCLPGYDKHINPREFTQERINDAIQRAKKRDNPPCRDWPHATGTTVYKLAEKLTNGV